MTRARTLVLALALAAAPVARPAGAQRPSLARPAGSAAADTTSRASADSEDRASPESPRAALLDFFELAREGQYEDAARYLDLPRSEYGRGPLLARRLKDVLDRYAWIEPDRVSAAQLGDTTDGLPAGVDQIATIPVPGGYHEPVRMVAHTDPSGTRWLFSRATVGHVDQWYQMLPNRWALERLPEPLQRPGPLELLWWQWLALPLLVIVAWGIGYVLSRLARWLLQHSTARTSATWDDAVVRRLGGPLTLALTLVALYALIPVMSPYAPAAASLHRGIRVGWFIAFFWALLRTVDVLRVVLATSAWALARPASRSLLPLGARVAKVLIYAMAIGAILSILGYPAASLITGFGIGGLAVALAAQKTMENLFGAFSIGVDQPFREGDFVKIEDFVGTVEQIGLRSTRVRTLDRTLITIPNGKLADMRTESFAVRDRIRFFGTFGLVYETTAAQMREVLAGFERVLREHPKLWPDSYTVRFASMGASTLNVEVMAWFLTADWNEFTTIRQEVLLAFMDVVERAGTGFAFPTQTVHVVPDGRASGVPGSSGGAVSRGA